MYKKAFLFLNGDAPDTQTLQELARQISLDTADEILTVSADGAFYYIRDYFLPRIVVADFDSASAADIPPSVEVIKLKPEKDFTDGHIALEYIIEKGITDITIYGAAGGRPDHILSNYSLLALAAKSGATAQIDAAGFLIRLISGDFAAKTTRGKIVSLVPYTDTAHILYTKGLKYPLCDKQLDKVHILGISNVAESDVIECGVKSGTVLIFLQK